MTESTTESVRQLQKKGVQFLETTAIVPNDHGCGNKSFGRLDNLKQNKYTVLFINMAEKTISTLIKRARAEDNTPIEIVHQLEMAGFSKRNH